MSSGDSVGSGASEVGTAVGTSEGLGVAGAALVLLGDGETLRDGVAELLGEAVGDGVGDREGATVAVWEGIGTTLTTSGAGFGGGRTSR